MLLMLYIPRPCITQFLAQRANPYNNLSGSTKMETGTANTMMIEELENRFEMEALLGWYVEIGTICTF